MKTKTRSVLLLGTCYQVQAHSVHHDRSVNQRDNVLRRGIRLYSESQLTEKMADYVSE